MTTLTLPLPGERAVTTFEPTGALRANPNEPVVDNSAGAPREAAPMWLLVATVVLLGTAALIAEHDPNKSLQADHALTADVMELATAGGNAMRRIAFFAIAGIGLVHLNFSLSRGFRMGGVVGVMMMCYMLWAGLSIGWSIEPPLAVRRYTVLACCYVACLGISRNLTLREFCWVTLWLTLMSLLVGIGTELRLGTFRPWSGGYRFSGTLHPNTQGMYLVSLCCAARTLLYTAKFKSRLFLICVFSLGFAMVVLTKSRTSMAGLLVCLFLMWAARNAGAGKYIAGFCVAWLVSAFLLVTMMMGVDAQAEAKEAALMGRKEQTESLTGRLPLWEELSHYVERRPLHGYGYDSFWTADHIDRVSTAMEWGIREAHNGYLETTLGLGLIGLTIVLIAIVWAISHSFWLFWKTGVPEFGWVMAMGVYSIINSCTESGMTYPMLAPFSVITGFACMSVSDWACSPGANVSALNAGGTNAGVANMSHTSEFSQSQSPGAAAHAIL